MRCALSWTFYWLGLAACQLMNAIAWWPPLRRHVDEPGDHDFDYSRVDVKVHYGAYRLYNWLMGVSNDLQKETPEDYDWRLGPWRKGRDPDEEEGDE